MNKQPAKLGRYQILREVGRGAMGVVYKAHDPIIEREVAIKAIHLTFQVTSEEKQIYLNRFYREAKAAGKLNHPNIVTIYDVDEDKETGVPFIVMEYLEGTTLQEIISDGILLPLEDVNNIIIQIADALSYAHRQGVVHRDVKSANILILEGMKAKITDFGIARLSTSDLTKSGQFIGTPNYMSPEQIDGKFAVDGRSDLFSLGVIFYLLLTGERPFSGDSFTSISYKIVHTDPIPPGKMNPGVPESYNRIISKLLAKNPSDRYQTGEELIADLVRMEGQKVSSSPGELPTIDGLTLVSVSDSTVIQQEPAVLLSTAEDKTSVWTGIGRPVLAGGLILAIVAFIAGAWFFTRSTEQPAPPPVPPASAPAPLSRVDVQTRLDLGINYLRNGFYDKSLEQFQEVLRMDPGNTIAKKYIVEARRKKAEQKSAETSPIKQDLPAPNVPDKTKSVSTSPSHPVAPEVASVSREAYVHFEFIHPFPSGNFSVYLKEQLVYQGNLSAQKERILLFPTYKGKLTGKFEVPEGDLLLKLEAVSREAGVVVRQEIKTNCRKGETKYLQVKYVQVSRKLEAKWM